MDIEPGTVIAQRYRVQRQLGRGGMGEVFAAENIRTGRVVAVKLLRADTKQKSSAVARFRREARAAGAIHSDYVTQVLDVEDDPEHGIVIVFELLEGESLIDRLKRTGPMTFDELFPIVEQVWIGLADAHSAGVIHRDLKPSNVFLEKRPDGSHRVKILDFGISKLTKEVGGETLTEMGQNLGTFSFMPPEQIGKAKTVDHRADIYSCATLIYQAMSGQLPYAARNILMIVELKAKAEPRPLSSVMDTPVDPRLEAFLNKSLKREPADRYQTALEALEAWRSLKKAATQSASSSGNMPALANAASNPSVSSGAPTQPQQPPGFAAPQSQSTGGASTIAMHAGALGGPQRTSSQSNFQAVNLPSVASVADSTSDAGDNVQTVAIPMRRVNEALAQRGFPAPQPVTNPGSQPRAQPGAGLPRLHDDRPNTGTQLMNQQRLSAQSSGSLPVPQSRMGTMAMPSQPFSQPASSSQGPVPSQLPSSSGQFPQQAFSQAAYTPMPQGARIANPQTPDGLGQSGSHPRPMPSSGPSGTVRHQAINADDPAPGGDLQTAVYRRNDVGERPPPTVSNPTKRSPLVLALGMLLFLFLGFAIVAGVVWGVTGRLPFK